MKNFTQAGETISLIAPAATPAGQGVLVGFLFGVATTTVGSGQRVECDTRGVFTMAKTTGEAWTQGALLYWNDTTKALTTTVASNRVVGMAAEAALSGDTTGSVYLPGRVT